MRVMRVCGTFFFLTEDFNVFVSKKIKSLEKRIADLENEVHGQREKTPSPLEMMKAALEDSLHQVPQSGQIEIKVPEQS